MAGSPNTGISSTRSACSASSARCPVSPPAHDALPSDRPIRAGVSGLTGRHGGIPSSRRLACAAPSSPQPDVGEVVVRLASAAPRSQPRLHQIALALLAAAALIALNSGLLVPIARGATASMTGKISLAPQVTNPIAGAPSPSAPPFSDKAVAVVTVVD